MSALPLTFFSFVGLSDPSQHRRYNEWHQLDHRPENLALPGVAWGDRWARPTSAREHGEAVDRYSGVDYVAMYWFREPLDHSLHEWDALGEASFQWGRGPIIPGVTRPLLAFFRPVKGYAAPSSRVSPDVIPYRPNRGLHLTLESFADPHSAAVHERFAWEDQEALPALLDVDGVAGAWTFSFSHSQRHSSLPIADARDDAPGSLRIRLIYLDDDPETVAPAIDTVLSRRDAAGDGAVVELATTLRTIIPWQDW